MAPILSSLLALTLLSSLALTNAASGSDGHVKRDEKLPFLDYAGIELAANEAVSEVLRRRGLLEGVADVEKRSKAPKCKTVTKRKEWRTLTRNQKKSYLNAVKCLKTKDDYGISPISNTLYEAFVYVHTHNGGLTFHGCAAFAPWHRWMVWLHETAVKEVCGYNGPFPYWNYTTDYKNLYASPIFSTDPEIGYGTHGTTPYSEIEGLWGYKVDNGAFANWRVVIPEPHYLSRNFSYWKSYNTPEWGVTLGEWVSPAHVKKTLSADTFWDFETILDGLNTPSNLGIHDTPHLASKGDWTGPNWMNGTKYFPLTSVAPNDPIFYPHHAYVDAVFWQWQQQPGKQWQYNGSRNFTDPSLRDAEASDLLPFSGLGPDVPVALALKTENWPLCYTYEY